MPSIRRDSTEVKRKRSDLFRTVGFLLSLVVALAALPHVAAAHSVHFGQNRMSAPGHHHSGRSDVEKNKQSHAGFCSSVLGCFTCLPADEQTMEGHFASVVEAVPLHTIRLDPAPERQLRPPRLFTRV